MSTLRQPGIGLGIGDSYGESIGAAGGDELDDTRTHNQANELTRRDTDDNGTDNYTLTYDANGNLTDDGKDYEYVYDAFGRLRQAKRTDNQAVVAAYRYNGLGFRISYTYDTDHDGDVDASDQVYYWCYDEQWRQVATFRGSDANPKERFVHHAAGLGGYGGSGYIDSVILRDKDANSGWSSAADSTMEERRYYCQNWRADASALVTEAGKMVESVKYSPYGTPHGLPAGDTDSDGDWDATDSGAITGSYDIRKDAELDGDVDANDVTQANAITGGYQTLGRLKLSSTSVANRKGYAAYEKDAALAGTKYNARNKVLDAELGRRMQRSQQVPGIATMHRFYVMISTTRPDYCAYLHGQLEYFDCMDSSAPCWDQMCQLYSEIRTRCPGSMLTVDCENCAIDSASTVPLSVQPTPAASWTCESLLEPGPLPPPPSPPCGWYHCESNTIRLCRNRSLNPNCGGDGCDTMIHELIHASNMCLGGSERGCRRLENCYCRLCDEISAYAGSGECSTYASDPTKYAQCLCASACHSTRSANCYSGDPSQCCSLCRTMVSSGLCTSGLTPDCRLLIYSTPLSPVPGPGTLCTQKNDPAHCQGGAISIVPH